jgi:hypothetical protein
MLKKEHIHRDPVVCPRYYISNHLLLQPSSLREGYKNERTPHEVDVALEDHRGLGQLESNVPDAHLIQISRPRISCMVGKWGRCRGC